MKIVIVSGGWDPIHSGHIECLEEARALGDMLVVGINSDEWLTRKKGAAFMPYSERVAVMEAIKYVDLVLSFDDADDTAKDLIRKTAGMFPKAELIFANGGDRTKYNIPELVLGEDPKLNLSFAWGVGGTNKRNSSSWILNNWKKQCA